MASGLQLGKILTRDKLFLGLRKNTDVDMKVVPDQETV